MINQLSFIPVHVQASFGRMDGDVLRVIKDEAITDFDENTYAKLLGTTFHNGKIRVKVYSRLLANAPDFARRFIGLAFRIQEDDSRFESFYVRPTHDREAEDERRGHTVQYFSYPNFRFADFREAGITRYEGPADIGLDEWIDLRAVIQDDKAQFYVNNKKVLTVNDLKMGTEATGAVGLFVDVGTEEFFKDLEVIPEV